MSIASIIGAAAEAATSDTQRSRNGGAGGIDFRESSRPSPGKHRRPRPNAPATRC